MITPARRGDERRPAVIFLQHRPMIGPCRWITQRILGIGDARRRGAHRRVVAIATDACPGALVLEANEHRAVVGILAQLVRKGFVDTALATVGVLSLIHISEPTRLLSSSYASFCSKKKNT